MVNADRGGNSIKTEALATEKCEPNGSVAPLFYSKLPEVENRVYKLVIQIEKIRSKPCPKSKKLLYLAGARKQQKSEENIPIASTDEKTISRLKQTVCSICNEIFQSAQSLYLHKKKHHRYVCQICDTQCATKSIFDKHEKLHISNDHNLPHKCHLCPQTFDSRRKVRLHTRVMHSNVEAELEKSPPTISKEKSLRVKSCHTKPIAQPAEKITTADSNEKIAGTSKRSEPERVGTYGAVTFTCRVCGKYYMTVEEAEEHTREHMEVVQEEHKCNICKRLFKNETLLNDHLAEHLSRALRCPMCPKAFINRATLKIHMKSHNKG